MDDPDHWHPWGERHGRTAAGDVPGGPLHDPPLEEAQMLTFAFVLALVALLLAAGSAAYPERAPLWASVIILCILALIQALPLGR